MDKTNVSHDVNIGDGDLVTPAPTPSGEEHYLKPYDVPDAAQESTGSPGKRKTGRNPSVAEDYIGSERSKVRGIASVPPSPRHRSTTLPSRQSSHSGLTPTSSPRTPQTPPAIDTLDGAADGAPKLSLAEIIELTSTPESIPVRALTPAGELPELLILKPLKVPLTKTSTETVVNPDQHERKRTSDGRLLSRHESHVKLKQVDKIPPENASPKRKQSSAAAGAAARPQLMSRSITAPFPNPRRNSAADRVPKSSRLADRPRIITNSNHPTDDEQPRLREAAHIPESSSLPLPPFSIPTHLHLELSSQRPSPLYIQSDSTHHQPYESTIVKFERLLNFLLLPPQLEQVLLFGALTCLDAWLYTFTILPLRFLRAMGILISWFFSAVINEARNVVIYVYFGIARLWGRRSKEDASEVADAATQAEPDNSGQRTPPAKPKLRMKTTRSGRHRHSTPSLLQVNHKADLLQGLLIIFSCVLLTRFDASRIYHAIRGQSAMKLYVIYNVLEVFDRLFSALGQDIIECLLSAEVLDRKADGRSRVFRPFWMFFLALIYTVLHAMAFFYQVITLNVAVNSYSNALLTLLMSNQFVEIKGTVFKKIEKENLFQLTCADVVERFQLWLMLLIIALRNIVELGGLSITSGDLPGPSTPPSNATTGMPLLTFGILPNSFTILPSLFPAQVLVPFLVVLGSEMLVDWLKHAYISKFNATSPSVYGRFLDILAKDYYSNAFAEQNLMKRLGLPVIPLACLFIRATLQTYHMFLATNVSSSASPFSSPITVAVALDISTTSSPVIAQIDTIFRTALGRSSFGTGASSPTDPGGIFHSILSWTLDDVIALSTMLVFFVALYLVLLIFKLLLGMVLLRFARDRCVGMKMRERQREKEKNLLAETKRIGGWGAIEVGDERRRVIYEGDDVGLKAMRDREANAKGGGGGKKVVDLDRVDRYSMIAKRIW